MLIELLTKDIIRRLREGEETLAGFIMFKLDRNPERDPNDIIEEIINPSLENSVMFVLIKEELYEDAHFLQQEFKKIIIKPNGQILIF